MQANADCLGGAREPRRAWEGDQHLDVRSMSDAKGRLPWCLAPRRCVDIARILDPTRPMRGALQDLQAMQGGETTAITTIQADVAEREIRTTSMQPAWLVGQPACGVVF